MDLVQMFLASFFHKFYAEDSYCFLLLNVCYKIKVIPQDGFAGVVWVCFFFSFLIFHPLPWLGLCFL